MPLKLGASDVTLRLGSAEVDAYRGSEMVTFRPDKISGLQLWLDAADSSTISIDTGVSQWRDKSATGSVWAQAVGNEQPATGTQTLNGKNVLVFDGSNDSLSAVTPLNTSMPVSFFWVYRIVTATNFGMTYATGASDNINIRQSGTSGALEVSAGAGNVFLGTTSRAGLNTILSWVVPSGVSDSSSMFINGSALTLSSPPAPTRKPILTGTHYIGRRSDGFHLNGWVAEIIAYSTELSTLQRKAVESYLGKKWGITVA